MIPPSYPEQRVRWLLALLACLATSTLAAAQPPDLSGIWWLADYRPAFMPEHGEAVPFTDAGRALYEQHRHALQSGAGTDSARAQCVPPGVPRTLGAPYPFEIVQTDSQVDFIFEVNRAFRVVLLQAEHQDPNIWDPSYMGDAIAHWERNLLIIDSRNFNDKTWLDDSGLPHSDQLHVTEQLQLMDGGQRLLDRITIEDSSMYAHPWSTELQFKRRQGLRLQTDWVCGESHRAVGAGNYR
jgi:hypothetical protein